MTSYKCVYPDGLNIRAEPSSTSSIIGTLEFGDEIVVKSWSRRDESNGERGKKNNDDQWLELEHGGYICGRPEFVRCISQQRQFRCVFEDGLNIRSEPSLDSKVVGSLEYGDIVVAVETKRHTADNNKDPWIKCEKGWCCARPQFMRQLSAYLPPPFERLESISLCPWTCTVCTFINLIDTSYCQVCRAGRPVASNREKSDNGESHDNTDTNDAKSSSLISPTRPNQSFDSLLDDVMTMSLSETPGGAPVKDMARFQELLHSGEAKRLHARSNSTLKTTSIPAIAPFLCSLEDIRGRDEGAEEALKIASNHGFFFALSELVFFARYYFCPNIMPESIRSDLFQDPTRSSPYYSTLVVYLEGGLDEEDANAMLLENRLESLTACGHLADTFLQCLYFPSLAEQRDSASSLPINQLALKERPEALVKLLSANPDKNYVVLVHVNQNHVFLLDFPNQSINPDNQMHCYRIESLLFILDSTAYKVSISKELKKLSGNYLNKFVVHEYDNKSACRRLGRMVNQCWDSDRLVADVLYQAHTKSWSQVLDFIFRINLGSIVRGRGVWQKPVEYV